MLHEATTSSGSLVPAAALSCGSVVAVLVCSMRKRTAGEAGLGRTVGATAATSTAQQPMDYSNRARAPIVAVLTTDDFRNAAQNLVSPSDVVLEVGCADGITTNLIHKYAADVVGIDTAAGVIAKAKQRYPVVDFRQMDGTDVEAVQQLRPRFDKVFVDIAGVISLEALLPILAQLDDALRPGLVVVKSKALAKLQNQLQRGAVALRQTNQPPLPSGVNSIRPPANTDAEGDEVTTQLQPVEVQRGRTVPVTRVLRLSGAVDAFLQANEVQHSIKSAETAWPFASQKPPTNPATRHAACGIPAADVIKCWFVVVERSETPAASSDGGDAHHSIASSTGGSYAASDKSRPRDNGARCSSRSLTELVWLVAAGSATVNLAAVARALGVENAAQVRLANRQQLSTSLLCQPNGHETDLVYSSKKFRLCPPLVQLPAAMDIVVMAELFGQDSGQTPSSSEGRRQRPAQCGARRHYVEIGFGKYAILGDDELRRALRIAAAGLLTPKEGHIDGPTEGRCSASPRGRVLEVAGLQAPTDQRGQILC